MYVVEITDISLQYYSEVVTTRRFNVETLEEAKEWVKPYENNPDYVTNIYNKPTKHLQKTVNNEEESKV